jgi:uncharacterized protein YecA (UPF0149 family)
MKTFLEVFHHTQALALENKIGLKANAKISENNILNVRRNIGLKKLKPLLEKSYFELDEELKPYFDINIFLQNNTIQKQPIKPKLNEPCPCGSGKKYKKCCGSIVP